MTAHDRLELAALVERVHPELIPFSGPQRRFVESEASELFFGGSRGPGKTHGMLLAFDHFRRKFPRLARGLIMRATYPQLEEIMLMAEAIFPFSGGTYHRASKTWTWPEGAILRLRHLENAGAHDPRSADQQGFNYNWIGIDEAGAFPSFDPINRLRGSLRSAHGVPVQLRLTGNPGGPNHEALKQRYVLGQYEQRRGWDVEFIPSTIQDNPEIMRKDPHYVERLRDSGPEWLVRAWLVGDWDLNPGGFFDGAWKADRQVLKPFAIPKEWPVYVGMDWGFSRPSAVVAIAISPGHFAETVAGYSAYLPPGSPIVFRELYTVEKDRNGWPKANSGQRLDHGVLGRMVREFMDGLEGHNIIKAVADDSIFAGSGGDSIYTNMLKGAGGEIDLHPCLKNERTTRAVAMLQLMRASSNGRVDVPGIFVFNSCPDWIRTVPILPADDKTFDDVDTSAEDHAYDATCYALNEVGVLRFASVGAFVAGGV